MNELQNVDAATKKKASGGFVAILAEGKVWAAIGAAALPWVVVFSSWTSVAPEQRAALLQTAIWATSLVVSAALAALGYQTGKEREGTVPEGYQSTSKVVTVVSPQGASVNVSATDPARVSIIPGAQLNLTPEQRAKLPPLDPNLPDIPENMELRQSNIAGTGPAEQLHVPGTPQLPPVQRREIASGYVRLGVLVAFAFALVSGGCAGTSEPFKRTISAGVNTAVADLREYNAARNWDLNGDGNITTGETKAQQDESRVIDALSNSVAEPATITLAGVENAWTPAAPIYREYVGNDPTLPTPEDKKIRLDTAATIDALIQKERTRQATNPFLTMFPAAQQNK